MSIASWSGSGGSTVSRWSRIVGSGLALAALAGALACRRPVRITLGEVELPGFGLVFVAHAQGYFADEGVEVVSRRFAVGRDALAAMLAGEVDVAMAYATPLAARALDGPDLRLLTTLHWSVEDTSVVARRDRGIATGEDLRGKRVGVPFGTSAEFFLQTVLAFSGVRPEEVVRVDLAAADCASALARGDVDAIAIWFPEGLAVELPAGALVEIRSSIYTELSALATREGVLKEKREAIVRLLRALSRAERLAAERPEVALAAVERGMRAWPVELVREGWSRVHPELGLSNLLVDVLERQAERQRARRGGGSALDFRRVIAAGPLSEVDPESITLLADD